MEKDFLLYLMYSTIIGIRERCYENNDMISWELCNVLHNIPLQLINEPDANNAYKSLIEKVDAREMQDWLVIRKKEFYSRYPQYKKED